MDLDKVVSILKQINSVCDSCNSKGTIINLQGQPNICEDCDGKGYHTFEELADEIKKARRK